MVNECCICYEDFSELDNNIATTCESCKNKICTACYNKSTELRMIDDKFEKLSNNCCVCRTRTEKKDLKDFTREQLEYFLKSAWELLHVTDKNMLEKDTEIEQLKDANLRKGLDLIMFIERAKYIVTNKGITKERIRERLQTTLKSIEIGYD